MLTHIGSRPRPAEDVVDLLLECHARIRSFGDLAVELAGARSPSGEDVRDAAERVRRYFGEALPLHVADEEESILPRLAGRDPSVDPALVAMHREHEEHAARIARVVSACEALVDDPARHVDLSPGLEVAARAMRDDLERHLAGEEATVFPAIRRVVPDEVRALMLRELRARRTPAHSSR